MSFRETETPTSGARAGNGTLATAYEHRQTADETKPSFKTTELWAAIVGVVVLVVVYNASSDASLDLFRACLLCTVLGAAYIVSRGFAKSGSRRENSDWSDPNRR